MTRITALAVSMFLIVMPLTALAGGGEPPDRRLTASSKLHPFSQRPVTRASSSSKPADTRQPTTWMAPRRRAQTILPNIGAGYTTLGDSDGGWPDLDGNGITDLVIQHTGGFTYAWLMDASGSGRCAHRRRAGGHIDCASRRILASRMGRPRR